MAAPVMHVVNRSVVDNDDVALMVDAINTQVRRDVAPAWAVQPLDVRFSGGRRVKPRAGHWVIEIVDHPDQPHDAAWHREGHGIVYGRVFAKPCLEHLDKNPLKSVAPSLSHEVLETLLDPFCSYWADNRAAGLLFAREICDPVQDDYYRIGRVSVSNFVFPAYFDPAARVGVDRFDYMRVLHQPFGVRLGGYVMKRSGTRITEFDAPKLPKWKRELKEQDYTRVSKRRASARQ